MTKTKKQDTATDKALANTGKGKTEDTSDLKTDEPLAEKDEEKQVEAEMRIRSGKKKK